MMASFYDAQIRAKELIESSLIDIAEMLIDLEEKVEAHEGTISVLEDELRDAEAAR